MICVDDPAWEKCSVNRHLFGDDGATVCQTNGREIWFVVGKVLANRAVGGIVNRGRFPHAGNLIRVMMSKTLMVGNAARRETTSKRAGASMPHAGQKVQPLAHQCNNCKEDGECVNKARPGGFQFSSPSCFVIQLIILFYPSMLMQYVIFVNRFSREILWPPIMVNCEIFVMIIE
jgi:hypothetical protein